MSKTSDDVLSIWGARGYYTGELSDPDRAKYESFIDQARQSICAYCGFPLTVVAFPDGLLYPWAEISYAIMTGGVFEQSNGTVTKIKEGDSETDYSAGINIAKAPIIDYSRILNRFRCPF